MKIVRTIAELKQLVSTIRQKGKTVGFVPTMGYLHEGHLSLVAHAKQQDDFIIMSIFVNPLQFGPNEDFERYPRDLVRDERLAKNANVDIIFYPDVLEMYPHEMTCTVHVNKGVDVLCGKSRPGHFNGVATVVLKLFNIVEPTHAYFGMKDAQQVAVIENMVEDFNLPVKVVKCPTLREEDGLAKSSRNVYLSPNERNEAKEIYASLKLAIAKIEAGNRNVVTLKEDVITHLTKATTGVIDYVEVLGYPSLAALDILNGQIIIAIALKFSKARLIDNVIVTIET